MANRYRSRGQSLVEFSLVLPGFFFMVILMLEFFFIARTKIVMEFVADRIARAAAAQGHPTLVETREAAVHFTVGPLWGLPLPSTVAVENLPRWPAYTGLPIIAALNPGGRLSTVDLSYIVFSKAWFGRFIPIPNLGAHVELPMEQEVPRYDD